MPPAAAGTTAAAAPSVTPASSSDHWKTPAPLIPRNRGAPAAGTAKAAPVASWQQVEFEPPSRFTDFLQCFFFFFDTNERMRSRRGLEIYVFYFGWYDLKEVPVSSVNFNGSQMFAQQYTSVPLVAPMTVHSSPYECTSVIIN